MRRAIRLGIFIGTVIGMSACAMAPGGAASSQSGAYGAMDAGRSR